MIKFIMYTALFAVVGYLSYGVSMEEVKIIMELQNVVAG